MLDGPGRLHVAGALLPDGRVLCWGQEPGHASRVFLQAGTGWKAISPEFGDTRAMFQAVLSPAGDRVAARHGDDLLLVSTATGEVRTVPGWPSGNIAGWTADSKSLFISNPGGDHIAVVKWNLETQVSEPWKRIDVKG